MALAGFGRYRIENELGRGGMGVVYRAFDPELERAVAIKHIQLPPDASREARDELEKRFRREAKAAARIRHPGVVAIHDVGITDSGLFLVMELVDGESLARRLERGAFPNRIAALEVAARAAEALGAAHRAGVIHRDVKPANILISSDGRVMLTDFGVARSLDEVSELTRTGMVVGSPAYMAPEQLRGAPVDGRADLFSLGVVLYELLLRKRPFPSQSITTLLYQILHEDPLADPAISRELDATTADALRQLLAKQPAERFPDAAAVVVALRQLATAPADADLATTRTQLPPLPPAAAAASAVPPPLDGGPALASGAAMLPGFAATPTPYAGTGAPRRNAALLAVATVLAAVIVAGGVLWVWNRNPERPTVQPPRSAGWTPTGGPLPEASLAMAAPTPTPPPLVAPSPMATMPQPTAQPGPTVVASNPFALPPPGATYQPPDPAPTPRQRPTSRETPSIELACQGHVDFDVSPDDAEVFVDGRRIGIVDDLESYELTAPGLHLIRLVREGYKPVLAAVRVSPDADDEDVELEVEMEELPDPAHDGRR